MPGWPPPAFPPSDAPPPGPPPGPPPAKKEGASGRTFLIIFAIAAVIVVPFVIAGMLSPSFQEGVKAGSQAAAPSSPAPTTAPVPPPPPTTAAAPPTTIQDQPFTGTGDKVITLPGGLKDARVAAIAYQGGSNFVVKALGSAGGRDDLLVNTIGRYTGTVPINFVGAGIDGFEINASGPWTLTLRDLHALREMPSGPGGQIDGKGDDVVIFRASKRTPLAVSCKACTQNFVVKAYGSRSSLLVNEIGAYDGTVLAPADTLMVEVTATGAWTIAVG